MKKRDYLEKNQTKTTTFSHPYPLFFRRINRLQTDNRYIPAGFG
jgi:hypothetical protein